MAFVTLYSLFVAGGSDDTGAYLTNTYLINADTQDITVVNMES